MMSLPLGGCPYQCAALIIPELISRNTDFGFLWLQLKVKTKVGKIQGISSREDFLFWLMMM
jgi:hypothetical protein